MKMEIAKMLIKCGCVKLSPSKPFLYASGLKGPIYCDNRLILGHVEFRDLVISKFVEIIKSKQMGFDLIGGIATAGIPYAAFISDRIKSPMIYIRPKAKEHGKNNQIEGQYVQGQSVILVEDLVNQGSSLLDARDAILRAGLNTSDCLCIVDYQMPEAQMRIKDLSINLHSLTDFDHLIDAAIELEFIDIYEKKLLTDWHSNPKEWSKLF
jgi:orotate phosphoribosyltransferase